MVIFNFAKAIMFLMFPNTARRVANSLDPDQTPHSEAAYPRPHCLLRAVCLNT